MKYRVIEYFTDLQDNNHAYHVGDTFPHDGMDVKPSRLVELSGSDNKRGIPLIEGYTDDADEPKAAEETVEETVTDEPKVEPKTEPKKRGRKKVSDNGNDAD